MLERVTGNVFFRLLSEFLYYHNGTPHLTSSLLSFLVCSGGETQANRTHTQREENIASCLFSFSCQIGVCFQGIFFPRAVLYIVCSLKFKKNDDLTFEIPTGQLQLVYGDGICTRRRDVLTPSKNWQVQVCACVVSICPPCLAVLCLNGLGVSEVLMLLSVCHIQFGCEAQLWKFW